MKKRTPKQYAVALDIITDGKSGKELEEILVVFSKMLIRDKQTRKLEKIVKEYENILKKREGVVEINVTSARKLGEDVKKIISKAFGGKVEMKENVEKDILGGLVVQTEDTILDASIRTQLRRLATHIS